MSNSREDRFHAAAVGKSRRTTPTGDSQGSIFFQGQGLFSNVVDISQNTQCANIVPSSYSNQYTQPRSSPGRYDINPQALYNQWPSPSPTPASTSFPPYEQDRYTQPSYTTSAYPSRSSPPLPTDPADSRKLPPLATSSAGERWSVGTPYINPSPAYSGTLRSPTSYHTVYTQYPIGSQASGYTYHIPAEQPTPSLQPMSSPTHIPYEEVPRSTSPFHRGSAATASSSTASTPHVAPPPTYNPPPISPSSAEEPTIKKKRKRADAAQLKVLNETYARTAFPSTEERLALAKMLDMSARSVQIW
ncbi:hypothetical protein AX16_005224 [Volvariella volvacea WC 439]|nr:hypothetical protein AX16_005224 [Volvariella volvacea WC 439]